MNNHLIPAIYENGIFRPLKVPPDLVERQKVQLIYLTIENELTVPMESIEDRLRFVHETQGSWSIQDHLFRHWLAEEATLYHIEDEV